MFILMILDPSASAPPKATDNNLEVKAKLDDGNYYTHYVIIDLSKVFVLVIKKHIFFSDPTKSLPSVSDSKLDLPDLPTVPSDTPPHDATPDQKNDENDEDLDFDDLTRRFEALKKKK